MLRSRRVGRESEEAGSKEGSFDVVIVGGRVAGASLAIRLGRAGKRVLLVDRATFPSRPTVPSCPIVHAGTMALLDELGVDEASYADETARFSTLVLGFDGKFMARASVPRAHGRDYVMGIDRATFDQALWDRVGAFPSVERRSGFAFEELVKDARGRVIGIRGTDARPDGDTAGGGAQRVFRAPWVIGADGRYSAVARKANARVTEDSDRVSTVYYADWTGLTPPSPAISADTRCMQVLTNGRGANLLLFPMPEGKTTIGTHERADQVSVEGDAEAYYARTIDSFSFARARLHRAKRASSLVGIKKIANRYVEPGGPGWLLVGDAAHMKDPVDGQGIYDALLETKILAELLCSPGRQGGDSAGVDTLPARWAVELRAATHGFFVETLGRLQRELYTTPPPIAVRTALKWLMTDPVYHERFFQFATRSIRPEGWMNAKLVAGCMARGIARDLRGDKGLPHPP